MVLNVTAIEDLHAGEFVSLLFNDSDKVCARKCSSSESPDAIAAREILNGDSLVFDTGRSTTDLLWPGSRMIDSL
jgi:hypothetical protein